MVAWPSPGVATPIVGAPGTVPVIPKLCDTDAAAAKLPPPACEAVIVHRPSVSIVTFEPDTEQTLSVFDVNVTGNPEDALAVKATGVDPKDWVPGFANVIVWLAVPLTVSVKDCCTDPVPFVAVNVNGYVAFGPAGVPERTPVPAVKLTPEGRVPLVSERVGVGMPAAATVKVLEDAVEKVVAFALVKAGPALRFRFSVAVSGASVGIVVTPHCPSASTAAAEAEFRLIT